VGTGLPSGVQGPISGGGLDSGVKPPKARYMLLSNAFLRRFVAETVFHFPYDLQKSSSDLREFHDPTRPEQYPPVPTRGYATGCGYSLVFEGLEK